MAPGNDTALKCADLRNQENPVDASEWRREAGKALRLSDPTTIRLSD